MMTTKKDLEYFQQKHYVNVDGNEIPYHKINNDINGNPRRVVHFIDLGVELEDYGKIPKLSKYRAKWFGGGYVLESCYNIQEDLKWTLEQVDKYYKKKK